MACSDRWLKKRKKIISKEFNAPFNWQVDPFIGHINIRVEKGFKTRMELILYLNLGDRYSWSITEDYAEDDSRCMAIAAIVIVEMPD